MMHPAIAEGRVAVITGGASGIGLAVAQKLASHGMRIAIADRDEEALEQAVALFHGDVLAVQTDVSKLSDVEALRDQVLEMFGEVTFLMNNAGRGAGGGAFSSIDGWQEVLGVNLWGVIHGL